MSSHTISSGEPADPPASAGYGGLQVQELDSADSAHAMPFILRNMTAQEQDALNRRLKRKIDIRLLPMMVVIYMLNYLDRNNIASARLADIEKDLNLQSGEFQMSVGILFVGYLLMQVPSNMFLNKIGKPAVYLPSCMIIWGIISGVTGGVQSYGGLLACRFFLGFVEAAYFPGCLFYLSAWYTREELVLRTALLYSGSLISGAFAGLLTAGIVNGMTGVRGLGAWRWLFIIEGCVTVCTAAFAYIIMPNFPRTTAWLTDDEKAMAIWRLEEDIGTDDWVSSEEQSIYKGALLASSDIKSWMLLLIVYGFVSSGSVTTFFPTVVATLQFDNVKTLLLTTPPYILATILILLNAWHADRTRERYLHVVIGPAIAAVAFITVMTTDAFAPRYLAMMLMVGATYSGYVVTLGWISNVLPRPPAKRAAALAGINALSNACQIYSPFLYPTGAGPRYVLAMSVNAGMSLLSIAGATALRLKLQRLNRLLDQGVTVGADGRMNHETRMTDVEDRGLPADTIDKGFRFLV